jgi:hypothetical protein
MAQLAFGETGVPGFPRWRLARMITAAPEAAARMAMTMRIGTRGEEPPSSSLEDVCRAAWVPACDDLSAAPPEPFP